MPRDLLLAVCYGDLASDNYGESSPVGRSRMQGLGKDVRRWLEDEDGVLWSVGNENKQPKKKEANG